MARKVVGLIGWRGMVGSVLMQRMLEERDFELIEPVFFSSSMAGKPTPDWLESTSLIQDAYDFNLLKKLPIILTAQGGDYTTKVYQSLRNEGWKGIWIDASSTLRLSEDSVIILDPVNYSVIEKAIKNGIRNFIGGNCTVSCMLMALSGLFKKKMIDWIISTTYQAASGGGAKHIRELLHQFGAINNSVKNLLNDPSSAILEIDRKVLFAQKDPNLPRENFNVPLGGNLIPWIDKDLMNGISREEWKAEVETNKILDSNQENVITIDGFCIRIGAMRCHSQALTVKLKEDIPLDEIESIISDDNQWVKVIPNKKDQTINELTPVAVSGTLDIPIGRLRKLKMGKKYLGAFTVGDQLLWGAAEPLRRMLRILLQN